MAVAQTLVSVEASFGDFPNTQTKVCATRNPESRSGLWRLSRDCRNVKAALVDVSEAARVWLRIRRCAGNAADES